MKIVSILYLLVIVSMLFTSKAFVLYNYGVHFHLFYFVFAAFAVAVLTLGRERCPLCLRVHPLIFALSVVAMVVIATSLLADYVLPSTRIVGPVKFGSIVVICIVIFQHLTAEHFNLIDQPKLIAVGIACSGVWFAIEQIHFVGKYDAAAVGSGPFVVDRTVGVYMSTLFFILLAYLCHPQTSRSSVISTFAVLPLTIYMILVSGNRSSYIVMLIGSTAIAILLAFKGIPSYRRRLIAALSVVAMIVLVSLLIPRGIIPGVDHFKSRMSEIMPGIESMLSSEGVLRTGADFIVSQREGAIEAFLSSPLIGIGWENFRYSKYSEYRTVVHSMLLGFLAESGILGFTAYGIFLVMYVLFTIRLWLVSKGGGLGVATLVLLVGTLALLPSYIYNRHIFERTWWLFFSTLISFDYWYRIRRFKGMHP